MSPCPACGKPIEALWKGVTKIVDGKITQFCSPACAAAGVATGAPAPAAPGPKPAAAAKPTAAAKPSPTPSPTPSPSPSPTPTPTPSSTPSPSPTPTPSPSPKAAAATRSAAAAPDDDEHTPPPRRATDLRRRRNRRALWLAAGIVAGGMAVAIIQTFSPAAPTDVRAARDDVRAGGAVPADAPAEAAPDAGVTPLDAATARARAEQALRALLPSPSTRIAREAAMALSRTGDAEAVEALARLLETESSTITRLEVAYALARAGDARGGKALHAGLRGATRDVRADAARWLALLGDQAAVPVLEQMMAISQYRLGAAETLARLGHARALAVLDAALASPRTSHEDRMRALVALGRAGRADVAPGLHEILDDGMYNVGGAAALARLGDRVAEPRLREQLEVPTLQVGAALGLRRLDPALDPLPLLPALVAALDGEKDTARVSAAEAILILVGPPSIAERD